MSSCVRLCVRAALGFCLGSSVTGVPLPEKSSFSAQDQLPYIIQSWQTEHGLPQNYVTSITQTPDGYLWIGSYNGLARFDGVRFVTFEPSNTPALRHPRVERLFTDASGTLWINTHDGSLASWRAGRFTMEWARAERVEPRIYPALSNDAEQAFLLQSGAVARRVAGGDWRILRPPDTKLTLAYCVADGVLWTASADGRVWRMTAGRLEAVDSVRPVRALAAAPDGRVFAGTDRGLAAWD